MGHGKHRYLIALGSNMRHVRHGPPRKVLAAALGALEEAGLELNRVSSIVDSAPLGPSRRRYANAAAVIATKRNPEGLLAILQSIEAEFGRKRTGQRWGPRVLDLDILLWSGGAWACPWLTIPHPLFRQRIFALAPAAMAAPAWRDPISGLTLRQLLHRLTHPTALLGHPAWSGP